MTNPYEPEQRDDDDLPGDGEPVDADKLDDDIWGDPDADAVDAYGEDAFSQDADEVVLESVDTPQPIGQPTGQMMSRGGQTFQPSVLTCFRCGYNLTGVTIGGSCPECGTPVDESIAGTNQGVSSSKAIASMVLGICALPGCFVYGIPALVLGVLAVGLGYSALKEVRDGKVSTTARAQAMTGIICGGIATGLVVVAIIGFIFLIAINGF